VLSPFVAHIVDAETEASQPFVVSEYVEGPTLAEILVSGPVPLRGVAALSYHLASTTSAAQSPESRLCGGLSASIHPLHSPHRPCPKIIVLRSASL